MVDRTRECRLTCCRPQWLPKREQRPTSPAKPFTLSHEMPCQAHHELTAQSTRRTYQPPVLTSRSLDKSVLRAGTEIARLYLCRTAHSPWDWRATLSEPLTGSLRPIARLLWGRASQTPTTPVQCKDPPPPSCGERHGQPLPRRARRRADQSQRKLLRLGGG